MAANRARLTAPASSLKSWVTHTSPRTRAAQQGRGEGDGRLRSLDERRGEAWSMRQGDRATSVLWSTDVGVLDHRWGRCPPPGQRSRRGLHAGLLSQQGEQAILVTRRTNKPRRYTSRTHPRRASATSPAAARRDPGIRHATASAGARAWPTRRRVESAGGAGLLLPDTTLPSAMTASAGGGTSRPR
jgi:hypothetical protein